MGRVNTGLWNLTYFVFGAIIVSSTLSSRSVLIPSHQFLKFSDKLLSVVGNADIEQCFFIR